MHKNKNLPSGENIPPPKRNNYPSSLNQKNILNDPEVIYQEIRHFNSFEEMNEADAQEMAAIPPIIHLQNATIITKKVFSEELKNPMDMSIKFKRL